ncbi:hypothetical protein A3A36_00540 [Candidatus Kaiserbacteria bacterium RIFCSPLOWO2_01_FULL_52_12b]|uniref:Prepilin peptidase A24 N-terminal domain-containing protein n=1 Tax=Candidatus Kaiserbacteria bacterium RIFCSPLOWO2_01_FULL_52_12b TaxID=1798509 RepID=A0A1F6EY21_9BACT|nr:MAG: hypothetical protein A3A36_00540 [Candidatus Kaiserbacteria bacterium RIFCSPLOWO2_01_FULL_52_12b]
MVLFAYATLFVVGSILASFVGVVVSRINTGQGFFTGRSRCDACNTPLTPLTLVPIISYLTLRGRAHCCGTRFSPLAPLSELLLGGLFVLAYSTLGLTMALPLMLLSLTMLLALVLYDFAHQILPPTLLLTFVVASVLTGYAIAPSIAAFSKALLVAFLIAMRLALIHFLSRGRAMGLSDAPLAFGLALLAGPAALPGFIFSFWIGAVIGIAILARRPVGSRMMVEVPFAPYLAAGFLLAYFTQWNPFALIASTPIH